MIRRRRLPILKLAFGIAYTLFAVELYLRYIAPVPIMPRYVVETSYGVRANQPNTVYYQITPECYVRMEMNSKGIRASREIPYNKSPGVRRIVALGDSFGIGYEVNQDEMFITLIEQALKQAGIQCEVVNLSVSGHGNAEELIVLREEGLKYDPDLVLVCWSPNDMEDNTRSSLFKLENGGLVQINSSYLPGTRINQTLSSYRSYRWLCERCQLYSFVREWAGLKGKSLLLLLNQSANKRVVEVAVNPAGPIPAPLKSASRPSLNPEEQLVVALLREIERESLAHGAQMLVLDIPSCAIGNHVTDVFPTDPDGRDFGLRVARPIERFKTIPDDQPLYRKLGHAHLTPLGCRIISEQLVQTILRERMLESRMSPGARGESGLVHPDPQTEGLGLYARGDVLELAGPGQ